MGEYRVKKVLQCDVLLGFRGPLQRLDEIDTRVGHFLRERRLELSDVTGNDTKAEDNEVGRHFAVGLPRFLVLKILQLVRCQADPEIVSVWTRQTVRIPLTPYSPPSQPSPRGPPWKASWPHPGQNGRRRSGPFLEAQVRVL